MQLRLHKWFIKKGIKIKLNRIVKQIAVVSYCLCKFYVRIAYADGGTCMQFCRIQTGYKIHLSGRVHVFV